MDNLQLPPLTKEDIRTLESMLMQSFHEANVLLNLIEIGLWRMYRDSKDFRKLVKQYGHNADAIVKATVREQLTKDETYQVGKILKKAGELKYLFDQLTGTAIAIDPSADDRIRKEAEMFEALMHDAKLMAWRHAMMCNITDSGDLQLDSTLKLLAKDHRVSDRIIQRLKQNSEII